LKKMINCRWRLHFVPRRCTRRDAERLGNRFNIAAARIPNRNRGHMGREMKLVIIIKPPERLKPPPFRTWRSATWVQKFIQFKGGGAPKLIDSEAANQ
jgi:hypothetical protein